MKYEKSILNNMYWIKRIKRECRIENGEFNLVSYMDNPHTISNYKIKDDKGVEIDARWFHRNMNLDLVRKY